MGEKSKYLPMQSLDSWGTQMEHGKTPHHISLAIQNEFKSKAKEFKTPWQLISSHEIAFTSTMSTLVAKEESKITR